MARISGAEKSLPRVAIRAIYFCKKLEEATQKFARIEAAQGASVDRDIKGMVPRWDCSAVNERGSQAGNQKLGMDFARAEVGEVNLLNRR